MSKTKTFDPSVLGFTPAEVEAMDAEERAEAVEDCLNRAADLVQAVTAAFPEAPDVSEAFLLLVKAARTL